MNINKQKNVYGYIRVSTPKQGKGVSLTVQKNEIIRFAQNNNLKIIEWFEEKKSASKGFRPQFDIMVGKLHEREAEGFIAHKIDRMIRNRNDWALLNHFVDNGYELHSAGESIDFTSASGRFIADIQAAQATHYSSNLAQEAKKGIYGRLKQGFLPRSAPIGYLNNGGGEVKTIDPIKAPLVKKLFALYTKEGYSIRDLVHEMNKRGLTNTRGNKISKNSIISILRNPFYKGIAQSKGQHFKGNHEPLISSYTFKRTQDIMDGKVNTKVRKHQFVYRKLLNCKNCGYKLIGEFQKGNIYYRCHTKGCLTKSIREDTVNLYVSNMLASLQIEKSESVSIESMLEEIKQEWVSKQRELLSSINLRLGSLESKLQRVTDLLIEGVLDKDSYESEKRKILASQQELNEQQNDVSSEKMRILEKLQQFLELAKKPNLLYDLANIDEKRELLEIVTSNLKVEGKKLEISMPSAFYDLANRDVLPFGGGDKTTTLNKACTITYQSVNTSPILPTPLEAKRCKEFLDHLLEEVVSLPEINLPLINELQTNHPSTKPCT